MQRGSILADDDAFESRLILDEEELKNKVQALKTLGLTIVLTSGSFDLTHIGHMRYLREARRQGDILIVGVDSDHKVRARKGKFRPIVPELERAEMIAHSRYVDIVTIKDGGTEKWSLIKAICPDVLVISERTGYEPEQQEGLAEYCKDVRCLEPQAETSTSAGVRRLQLETLRPSLAKIREAVDAIDIEFGGGDS